MASKRGGNATVPPDPSRIVSDEGGGAPNMQCDPADADMSDQADGVPAPVHV
jgi:hypothetical protein